MTIPRPVLATASVIGGVLLFLLLGLAFIPDRALEQAVTRALTAEGYTFKAVAFGKAFPLGLQGKRLEIGTDAGPVLVLDRAAVRLKFLPLLTGRVTIALDGRIGAGTIIGTLTVAPQKKLELTIRDLPLDAIPFFTTVAGTQAKGIARVSTTIQGVGAGAKGTMQLQVRGAELNGIKIGETPLPDAAYREVQGMLRVGGGRANLESFTLQGDALYVRLKGDMPISAPLNGSPLNLTLELMPKPEFLERQKFVFLLLVKYLTSPGHYQIPIRGTLAKPLLQ
jgi:type II secretion system protein N